MDSLFCISKNNEIFELKPSLVRSFDSAVLMAARNVTHPALKIGVVKLPAQIDVITKEPTGTFDAFINMVSMPDGQVVFWATLDRMPLRCKFYAQKVVNLSNNKVSVFTPDILNAKTDENFEGDFIWNPPHLDDGKLVFLFVGVVVPDNANAEYGLLDGQKVRYQTSVSGVIKNYLSFRVVNLKEKKVSDYLPSIPNVYRDGTVCMGRAYSQFYSIDTNTSILDKFIQSLNWFWNSKMNQDLASDTIDRSLPLSAIASLNIDNPYITVSRVSRYDSVLNTKISNVYFSSIPS